MLISLTGSSFPGPLQGASFDLTGPISLSAVAARLEEPLTSPANSPFERDTLPTPESEPMPGSKRTRSLSCRCMRKQSDALCQLQTIEKQQCPVKVDTILTCVSVVLRTTEEYLRCTECRDDSRTLVQVIMIFQTIFSWVQAQCHSPGMPCPDLSLTLGLYEVSREESRMVKLVLISNALEKTRTTLKLLSSRVEQLVASRPGNQLWEFERADLRNLQHLIRSLSQTWLALVRRLATHKEQSNVQF